MPLPVYHIAHLIGLIFIFIGFGALLSSDSYKSAMKFHGIGLLISLVTGFGMIAKLAIPMNALPIWLIVKMCLWLVLGFLPVLAKRRVLAPGAVVFIALIIGGVLAYLGYLKPTA